MSWIEIYWAAMETWVAAGHQYRHGRSFGSSRTMGSDEDFNDMLAFVERQEVRPLVDKVFDFEDAVEAFDRMEAGAQFGKIVVKI